MDFVWKVSDSEVTVRDVSDQFPDYAYTTIATVLDRLCKKGVLVGHLIGNTRHFASTGSRGAHTAVLMHEALMADRDPDVALRRFVGNLTTSQVGVLRKALDDEAAHWSPS